MKTTPAKGTPENDLAPFIVKFVAQHYRVEFAFYTRSMKLIIDLHKRHPQQYLPLRLIRRSLSSLKIDRAMAKCLLKDLRQCGFIMYVPRRGYRLNMAVDGARELPYQPSYADPAMP